MKKKLKGKRPVAKNYTPTIFDVKNLPLRNDVMEHFGDIIKQKLAREFQCKIYKRVRTEPTLRFLDIPLEHRDDRKCSHLVSQLRELARVQGLEVNVSYYYYD